MDSLLIAETDHTLVSQAYGFSVPGYLIVSPRADATRFDALTGSAQMDLFRGLARAEAVIHRLLQPPRVYQLRFGEENPSIHFHVVPRTRAIEHAYVASSGDVPPLSGAALVDWIWQNHESLGHSRADLESFAALAREAWAT